jgi:hypothetical protein
VITEVLELLFEDDFTSVISCCDYKIIVNIDILTRLKAG